MTFNKPTSKTHLLSHDFRQSAAHWRRSNEIGLEENRQPSQLSFAESSSSYTHCFKTLFRPSIKHRILFLFVLLINHQQQATLFVQAFQFNWHHFSELRFQKQSRSFLKQLHNGSLGTDAGERACILPLLGPLKSRLNPFLRVISSSLVIVSFDSWFSRRLIFWAI